VAGILNGTNIFFQNNVMYEVACELNNKCDTDNYSFKAYLSRWMVAATKYAPFIYNDVMTYVSTSAKAAALQCSGGPNGQMCGQKWTQGAQWDGTMGVGQQMSALEVIQANLIDLVDVPVTNKTGGTSQGNAGAGGSSGGSSNPLLDTGAVTGKDKAGAGVLTTLVLISVIGGAWWMIA